jgi:hypothetical protein
LIIKGGLCGGHFALLRWGCARPVDGGGGRRSIPPTKLFEPLVNAFSEGLRSLCPTVDKLTGYEAKSRRIIVAIPVKSFEFNNAFASKRPFPHDPAPFPSSD